MRAPLTHPSYNDLARGSAVLAHRILKAERAHREPAMIIALSRGGLFPGVELSHLLELPLTPVCYSAKSGHGDDKNHLNVLPDLPIPPYSTVVLVDDIADSGHTLNEVTAHYRQLYTVETAVLYWKRSSVYTPTYYWKELENNSPWIEFPWEP